MPKKWKGLLEQGNIDLDKRKVLKNDDGSISTESSITEIVDGEIVNMPTVIGGKRYEPKEAIKIYRETGRHLGKFDSIDNAVAAAQGTHLRQEKKYLLDRGTK